MAVSASNSLSTQSSASTLTMLGPADIKKAYQITSSLDGTGQTVAIVSMNAGYLGSDINLYRKAYGLGNVNSNTSQVTNMTVVSVDGVSTDFSGSANLEANLDIDMVLAMAPNATLFFYIGDTNMDVYEKIANDHQAQIVTTSWYLSESVLPPAYVTQEETIFKQMKAQGQTMLASLGDAGFYVNQYSSNTICTNLFLDENMCHHFSGQSPAVQGLVTAVGGTSLFLNADGTYNNEVS